MTYPRTVTARLLDTDGTVVSGAPLANAFGVSFYDEENGVGYGEISLSLSEAGASEIKPGRFVDILVAGTSRFTFKIEGSPDYRPIQINEEVDQILTVRGRGWACVFDEAITYPEFDLTFSMETSWRLFTFASPSFPNGGSWPSAHETHEYFEGVEKVVCYGHAQIASDNNPYPAPIGFPWPTNPRNYFDNTVLPNYVNTYWIRPNATVMPDWNDTGYYFFRTTFTLATFQNVKFTVTGDNFFTLFLEGVPILGEPISNSDHLMWQGWKEHEMFLPAGTYHVAAAVYNIGWDDLGATSPRNSNACPDESYAGGPTYNNPGGLLFAAFTPVEGGADPIHVLSSDSSWTSYFEEETWPGWTPGQIIQKLIDEAVARGTMQVYDSNTFGATLDSNSDAWRPFDVTYNREDIPTFAVEVGSTLLQNLIQMHDEGFIIWKVQPGTLVLDVYRQRAPTSPASAATFTAGTNITSLDRGATDAYTNTLLVQWEGGYVVVDDTAAITAHGTRVEDIFSSDAATEEEAILKGGNELRRRAQESFPAIAMTIEPSSSADCPYEGFTVGDYVTVPSISGSTEVVRCLSIACQQDENGYASWTLELNAKLNIPERRNAELLRQIGGKNQIIQGVVGT